MKTTFVTLDKSLEQIVHDTVPTVYDTNLPYERFLVQNKFVLSENLTVTRIFVSQSLEHPDDIIYAAVLDFGQGPFVHYAKVSHPGEKPESFLKDMEFSLSDKDAKKIDSFILNIINVINNPDREIERVERFRDATKAKREGRTPSKTVTIKATGKLKRYVKDYNRQRHRLDPSSAFLVRGHWRRFDSDFYKEKRGQRVWIKPFVKGDPAKLVKKTVRVTE